MKDVVERLRGAYSTVFERSLAKEAADVLEAKDKEIERLRREASAQRISVEREIELHSLTMQRAERAEAQLASLHCPDDARCRDAKVRELQAALAHARREALEIVGLAKAAHRGEYEWNRLSEFEKGIYRALAEKEEK